MDTNRLREECPHMRITIPGTLPTLNEIIAAAKKSPYAYNDMKSQYTTIARFYVSQIPRIDQFDITFTWYCPDRRKDKDGIMAGQKFIFDGMQQAGVIKNDGWKQVRNVVHRFEIDKDNPRVELEIREVS